MKQILQNSDFAIKVSFYDISGRLQKIKSIKLSYSTPMSNTIIAEYDGVNYTPNCRAEDDGIIIIFENAKFNVGQLKVERIYSLESSTFKNGIKNITQIEFLPIEIVQAYSTTPKTPTPKPISPSNSDIIFTEVIIVESLQGSVGPKGEAGFNYSNLNEQMIPGEFWLGTDGVKRQVFTRTFQGSKSPASFPYSIPDYAYPCAWSFYAIGSIHDCRLILASIGSTDLFEPTTGQASYIWRGLDLWFKQSIDAKFNNVPYVLTFKYTKP